MKDQKLYKILKKHYEWKYDSKKDRWKAPEISDEEATYVASKGYPINIKPVKGSSADSPFPQETTVKHDEACVRLMKAFRQLKLKDVANGFLASLSSQGIEYRAGLAAYAYAMHFPKHKFTPGKKNKKNCAVCGMEKIQKFDFSGMYYRLYDWGYGLRLDPMEPAFCLEFFSTLPKVTPTAQDIKNFKLVIKEIEKAPPTDTGRKIGERIKKLINTNNKYKVDYFMETLAICGILETEEYKGFDKEYMLFWKTQNRPHKNAESDPPLCFWRAKDGINYQSLKTFFPNL